MKPDRAMRTHDNHAIKNKSTEQLQRKVLHQKYNKERKKADDHNPTD
jgi:hypothetical protein